ncbi:PEP-CTERM sorting domain-containing protein [Dasania marina]|uniref:PEP-CTERM sorting domain-containing protein n=1 Tax=Dasania marina TaxID=471499 RepID=UPI00037A99EF|nr:PEP-CTERM sorting domain-containing protein [Dasania marina]|tara:strand:+ start:22164 stop:22637 length:474 start_codon:yes stop_codon:yes gene_type:complete
MNNYLKALLVAVIISAAAPNAFAGLIQAEFGFGWGGDRSYTGTLSGVDADADGFLRFDELTAFSAGGTSSAGTLSISLSSLFDIGDIDLVNQVWLPNADSWSWASATAFITWDDRGSSCTTFNGCGADINITVPEPGSIILLAIGLIGLGVARRSQK